MLRKMQRQRSERVRWLGVLLVLWAGPVAAQEFTTLKGHGGPIMALDVSPDGQLASASFDNSVGLWSAGLPNWLDGHDAAVVSVNFERRGYILSGSDDFSVKMWVLQNGQISQPIQVTSHKGKVSDVAWDGSEGLIASASWDGSIRLSVPMYIPGNLQEPKYFKETELLGHSSNVTDVGFSTDGTLFSASSDGSLRVWTGDGLERTSRSIVKHGFGINEMIVTDDWIAYGAVDGGTRVITPEGEEIRDFTLDRRPILAMDYHAATGQLAVGDGHGYIMMIDTSEWTITRDFRAMRQGPVWALAFSNDGTVIHAGGIDDVIYAWPVALLDQFDPVGGDTRSFLRDAASMPNGERQFMRKCSICHALESGPSRKAGPTLHGVFGRQAGTVEGYLYSATLDGSGIIWSDETIDALFDEGPDHYIPGSKMPMQVIAKPSDRADLIAFLKTATAKE